MLSFNAAIFINAQLACANYVFVFWIIDQSRLMILILGQLLMTNKENSHFTAKKKKKSLHLHWLTFSCMRETQQQHQRFIKLVKIHQLEESKCRKRNVEEQWTRSIVTNIAALL